MGGGKIKEKWRENGALVGLSYKLSGQEILWQNDGTRNKSKLYLTKLQR